MSRGLIKRESVFGNRSDGHRCLMKLTKSLTSFSPKDKLHCRVKHRYVRYKREIKTFIFSQYGKKTAIKIKRKKITTTEKEAVNLREQ